jgi:hypothetical protein
MRERDMAVAVVMAQGRSATREVVEVETRLTRKKK